MVQVLDEVEFLVRSDHRVEVLDTLNEAPHDRTDLRAVTGASSPTIGRVISDFENRRWIVREGDTYRLTDLGAFVAVRLNEFRDAMRLERTLRGVWEWLPHDIDGFDVELLTDAVVSRPGPGYPYQPVERLTQLISEATTMRGFGMAVLKSSNLEPFFDRTLDDLECEYIYPPDVFEALLTWNRDTVVEAATRTNYTVLLHDDLPVDDRCGVCLIDDRVTICCYDPETGTLQSLVDTGRTELCDWAESYYERFREGARALDVSDGLDSIESSP